MTVFVYLQTLIVNFWFVLIFYGFFHFIFFAILNEFLFVFHFFNQRMVRYSDYSLSPSYSQVWAKFLVSTIVILF